MGPGGSEARSLGQAGTVDLCKAVREAAEERYDRRRGDLRGGTASDHEFRGREVGGAAGQRNGDPHTRSSGSPAHADDQRVEGESGGVRRRGASRAGSRQAVSHCGGGPRNRGCPNRSARWPVFCCSGSPGWMRRSRSWRRSCATARARTKKRRD